MKVVSVVGNFPADSALFTALTQRLDLVVYGTRSPQPTLMHVPQPPVDCSYRLFKPLVSSTRGGHLRWVYEGMGSALSEDSPDVVHVVSEPWGMLAVQASNWARRHPGTALAIHGCDRIWSHGSAPERAARRLLARYSLSRADAYAAESVKAVDHARRGGLRAAAATAPIHTNPKDPAVFRQAVSAAERAACRRVLGLPSEGIGVGFLGRLVPEKGPFVLLDAVRQLTEDRDAVWFAMAGTGPEAAAVTSRAESQDVLALGGLRYPDEVALFYRAIDVFVLPSYRTAEIEEQSPRAVIEAMMSSCVVVGTSCGAIPEMIGDLGVVVAERDAARLAEGLRTALALVPDAAMRARARERAIAAYSGEAVASQLIGLWERAATPRRAAA